MRDNRVVMDQFIVRIERDGQPVETMTTIASPQQVEDLEIAAQHARVRVFVTRPHAVGTVLQWMSGLPPGGLRIMDTDQERIEALERRVAQLEHLLAEHVHPHGYAAVRRGHDLRSVRDELEDDCPECGGAGSVMADCTTLGPDCGCHTRLECSACDGEGTRRLSGGGY